MTLRHAVDLENLTGTASRLLSKEELLSDAELAQVKAIVYPHLNPSQADVRLQTGQSMSSQTVEEELGEGMRIPYVIINDYLGFRNSNTTKYATEPGLNRHLWDSAFRAQLMGLPLSVRAAAFAHDVPEFMVQGVVEAVQTINQLISYMPLRVVTDVALMTDFGAIIARDLFKTAQKKHSDLKEDDYAGILAKKRERTMENSAVQQSPLLRELQPVFTEAYEEAKRATISAINALHHPEDRLVPVTAASGPDWIMQEAVARINSSYNDLLLSYTISQLGKGAPEYDCVLVVKAIAHIDRMRTTMGDFSKVEKSSRKAINFVERLDSMISHVEANGRVNNRLHFLSRALKTEMLELLGQETANFSRRPDTTARYAGSILEERLAHVKEAYMPVIIPTA